MMERKNRDITNDMFLTFNTRQLNNHEKLLYFIEFGLASFLFILCMIYIQAFIVVKDLSFFVYMPGMILLGMLFLLWKKSRMVSLIIYVTLSAILGVILHTFILNGLFITMNEIFHIIGTHTGQFIAPYEVSIQEESYHLSLSIFLTYIGLLSAYIAYLIVKKHLVIVLWLLLVMNFILQSLIQVEGLFIVNIVLVLLVIVLSIKTIYKQVNISGGSKKGVYSIVFIYFLFISLIAGISVIAMNPIEEKSANSTTAKIQTNTKGQINHYRYEKDDTNNFTEGNFKQLGELDLKEKTALEIVMEKPTSLYLRGYVGSTYTSDQWLDIDSEIKYDNSDLYYWLNKEAFHPVNQLSTVNELMDDKKLLNETKVSVHNIGANSKYLYTPYELMTEIDDFEKINDATNETVISKRFFGERTYQFKTYENLISHYPTLANFLYDTKEDKDKEAYLEKEQYYNEFVYDVYTDLPDEVEMMLEFYLDKEEDAESHIAYEKAIKTVKEFLSRRLSYQLDPNPLPENADFLTHVLEDSKEGYATHYATAATLMFRYLDIPARYVEGYLVTPKDIKNKEDYEAIDIEGTNAHAWTEIYIDQLGWIPIETTPPYENMMEPIDTSNYPKGMEDEDENQNIEEEMDQAAGSKKVKDEEEKDVIDKKEKEDEQDWNKYLIIISIIVIILLLGFLLVYLLRKRLKLKNVKQSFNDQNINKAVSNMFSYSLFLLTYDDMNYNGGSFYDYQDIVKAKYGDTYGQQFIEAINMNQRAIYRAQELTKEERQIMLAYVAATVSNVVESKGFFQRLKMKYWDFIY